MSARTSTMYSKSLAVIGLAFWIVYVLQYVLGVPLFLVSEKRSSLQSQILFIIYGYVTLLGGVCLGVLYRELQSRKAEPRSRVNVGRTIREALRGPDFWMALFASPVVYVILLQAINLEEISLAGILALTLVGLQNGFVCNSVAESIMNRKGST